MTSIGAETTIGSGAFRQRMRLHAIGLICLAVLCFTFLDSTAKYLVRQGVPALEVVWARYVSHAVLLLFFVNPWTVKGLFRTKRPLLQIIRSVLLFLSTLANFVALKYLQLTETVSIMFSTPFLVAILAGVFFGQWIGRKQWGAIIGGFVGVLIVTRPGFGNVHWAVSLSCAGAVCYALYNLMTRVLAAYDPTTTTLVYSSLVGAAILTPFAPGFFVPPASWTLVVLLISTGLWGMIGHWLLIAAHRHVSAQDLSPFIYTQIVWMTISGWLVFGDIPGLYTIIGASVVILSGLYLLLLERRRKRG